MENVKEEEALLKRNKQQFLMGVKKLKQDKDVMDNTIIELKHSNSIVNNLQK
jgi:hypothetical protein